MQERRRSMLERLRLPLHRTSILILFCLVAGCAAPLHLDDSYREEVHARSKRRPRDVDTNPLPGPDRKGLPEGVERPHYDADPIVSLGLPAARALAVQRSHSVAAVTATVNAAIARIAEARAAFLPTLSVGANRRVNSEVREISFEGGSFSLSPEWVTSGQAELSLSLFAFGRDWESVKAARSEVDTKIFEEREARQRLVYEVTQAWYLLHETAWQVQVAEDALRLSEKQLEDAKSLVDAGRATKDAALTAELDRLQRTQELLVSRNAELHARRILNVLLLREADSTTTVAPAPPLPEVPMDRAQLKAVARENHPSILSFRTRRSTLEHTREALERGFAPEITGAVGAEYNSFREGAGYSTNYTATLGVQWRPIEGGRILGRLEEIHQNLVALREQELQAILDLELKIDRALLDIAEAVSAQAVAEQSITAATENHRILSDRFRAGKTTAREVLEAQRSLTDARFQLNRARFLHATLLAQIESLVGVESSDWTALTP